MRERTFELRTLLIVIISMLFIVFAGAQKSYASVNTENGSLGVSYSAFFYRYGHENYVKDNLPCVKSGYYPTGIRFIVRCGDNDVSNAIMYSVKNVGTDWSDWHIDNDFAGTAEADAALIGIRIKLNGELADKYDVYYKTLRSSGKWSDWAKNGDAGNDGADGTYILGLRTTVLPKGTEPAGLRIDSSRPMIALTYDDGPVAGCTDRILAALEMYGGKATFFMLGKKVQPNAGLVKRMVADGCEVGNHTWNHENITKISADAVRDTLNRTSDAIESACGVRPIVMRPPGGNRDDASLAAVGSVGMSAYYWRIDTRDWEHKNTQKTVASILDNVRDGDIILMHDVHSAEASEQVIPELINRGYQLVTVTELAEARGGAAPGVIYYSFK